ncbi:uncharacterized protein J7T54_006381 [Emericellopsis cladophorae]|uniref:Nitrogen regulatory protein areA GATA-like domain-containing protein n=1 Tax=Emericellopsis cladophorae TaxID=2686198 RepID=A0A9P9Y6J0_9HYPO|nr:uncharacterized protein J7T54_006381 [Emericellopsis cladophorae]KAI6784336.1 hypothetical protein J7T54_006381 [Emericellopsis cladophorae]
MWTVFSRCAESLPQGRRLENLSWRLWQKEQLLEKEREETLAAANANTSTTTPTSSVPQAIPQDARLNDLPQLSGSVESIADEEAVEFTSVSAPIDLARPAIKREDSSTSHRSRRDRRTSSDDFEKMIISIVKDETPLSAPSQHSCEIKSALPANQMIQRSGSTTTESQSPSKSSDLHSEESHPSPDMQPRTIVRGFSPSQQPIPRSSPRASSIRQHNLNSAANVPTSTPAANMLTGAGKPKAAFALGGASYSSSEAGQSVESRQPAPATVAFKKSAAFKLGGSSEDDDSGSLRSALARQKRNPSLASHKKQASFSNHVTTLGPAYNDQYDNAIADSDDSEGEYDEEDSEADWEDSVEDSGKSSVDDISFQRVDSKIHLPSTRSLLALKLAEQDTRAAKIGGYGSQSTSALHQGRRESSLSRSPNDSDDAPLTMRSGRQQLQSIKEVPRSGIATGLAQGVDNPTTIKRNMLSRELPDHLRRDIVHARRQLNSTAEAAQNFRENINNTSLKRHHTSHDLPNLKAYPDVSSASNLKFTDDFAPRELGYNERGW